jgi:chromosome segregation ATPase
MNEIFTSSLAHFECIICMQVAGAASEKAFSGVVQTDCCGHLMCKECYAATRVRRATCPMCNRPPGTARTTRFVERVLNDFHDSDRKIDATEARKLGVTFRITTELERLERSVEELKGEKQMMQQTIDKLSEFSTLEKVAGLRADLERSEDAHAEMKKSLTRAQNQLQLREKATYELQLRLAVQEVEQDAADEKLEDATKEYKKAIRERREAEKKMSVAAERADMLDCKVMWLTSTLDDTELAAQEWRDKFENEKRKTKSVEAELVKFKNQLANWDACSPLKGMRPKGDESKEKEESPEKKEE